ncbi:MAG: Type 1 glutamine amidotransferase-like domain-containing protein [Actinomycetota bacterium]
MPPATDAAPVSLAFLGSGEFEPWTEALDRWALARSANPDGVALVAPAASAHEGEHVFERWARLGLEHYRAIGVAAEVLDLRTRDDAFRDDVIARVDAASLVAFSGGNPARLAAILADTPLWDAIRARVATGLPYAGCSAGVSALCGLAFDNEARLPSRMWKPGLGALRDVLVAPHWDAIDRWVPGATRFILRRVEDGHAFLGIDERTAVVGDGARWEVVGSGSANVRRPDGSWERHAAGASFDLPIGPLR